ncbi:phosphatase PAP2 family protein [uncultured Parolsenella sp.]|uniref:phosphatase PAP2 family protein n=1 Tax=uncultured Parolsenella sp. TaxID=2083008 RepID=UPI0027D9BFB8|nr:phosphatase PAP2 family protein [uncultured Parolsenella sp.]
MGKTGARDAMRKLAHLVRQNALLVVVGACLLVFISLLEDVLDGELMKLDRVAYWLVVQHMRAAWLTPIMESFSALATPVTLLVLLLAVAAFAPGRRPGWCCAVNLGLVVLLNQVLKFAIRRPRPDGFRLATASGFSFPSGHSMVAMAFFGLLIWFVWRFERDRRMRGALVAAFAFVILMVGLSRVYLGVHYASDVLGGFCLSVVWLALYTRLAVPLFLDGEGNPLEGRHDEG